LLTAAIRRVPQENRESKAPNQENLLAAVNSAFCLMWNNRALRHRIVPIVTSARDSVLPLVGQRGCSNDQGPPYGSPLRSSAQTRVVRTDQSHNRCDARAAENCEQRCARAGRGRTPAARGGQRPVLGRGDQLPGYHRRRVVQRSSGLSARRGDAVARG